MLKNLGQPYIFLWKIITYIYQGDHIILMYKLIKVQKFRLR